MTPKERAEQVFVACNGPKGYDWRRTIEQAISDAVAEEKKRCAQVALDRAADCDLIGTEHFCEHFGCMDVIDIAAEIVAEAGEKS